MAVRVGGFFRAVMLIALPLALIAGILYFYTQSFIGDYGSIAREDALSRLKAAERENQRLQNVMKEKLHRNKGLRQGSVDLDLLDERAREELGLIRADEVFLIEE